MDCFAVEHHRKQQIRSWTVSFVAEAKYGDEIGLSVVNRPDDGFAHFVEARTVKSGKPLVQALVEWAPYEIPPRNRVA